MSTKLKINVTKEVLKASAGCTGWGNDLLGTNCAIAIAIRDIFPSAHVGRSYIDVDFWGRRVDEQGDFREDILLPEKVIIFIDRFDSLNKEERLKLPEIEFEIEIPDEVLDKINIDELKPLLENHPTLQLIN